LTIGNRQSAVGNRQPATGNRQWSMVNGQWSMVNRQSSTFHPPSSKNKPQNTKHMSRKTNNIAFWVLRIVPAVILLQTLFFKFTAAEESVYIFSKLGIEPWGRIGSGVAELVAAILILIPATTGIGAFLAMGVISGAIVSHLTVLGIEVQGDGGQLFIYALIVFISCALLVFFERDHLLNLIKGRKNSAMKIR
jgi:uncharacterized membrane protein YphA (DoxX/SURF4 family)